MVMGGVLAVSISSPVISLPLAFLSHYVLDYLPHFGQKYGHRDIRFRRAIMVDVFLITLLVSYLVVNSQWLAIVGGVVALSPDFAWIYRLVFVEKFGKVTVQPGMNKLNKFHSDIQVNESEQAYIVDNVFLVLGLITLVAIL